MRRNNVGYGVEGKIVYKARNAHSMHNGGRNKAEDGEISPQGWQDMRLIAPTFSMLSALWSVMGGGWFIMCRVWILAGILCCGIAVFIKITQKSSFDRSRYKNYKNTEILGKLHLALIACLIASLAGGLSARIARSSSYINIPKEKVMLIAHLDERAQPSPLAFGKERCVTTVSPEVLRTVSGNNVFDPKRGKRGNASGKNGMQGDVSGKYSVSNSAVLFNQKGKSDSRKIFGEGTHKGNVPYGHRARIRIPVDCSALEGQGVRATGTLTPSTGWRHSAQLRADSSIYGEPSPTASLVNTISHALNSQLAFSPEHARGLIPGVALGDDSNVEDDLKQAMKLTSLTHLIAVSGGHVSLVLTLVVLIIGRKSPPITFIASSLALGALVILVGPSPSVLRATFMGCMVILATLLGKQSQGVSSLCCSVMIACFVSPWLAISYGFLLSVCACFGIIVWGYPLSLHCEKLMPAMLAQGIAIPLVAQLSCIPVLLLFTEVSSIWGVLANALVAPVVAPLTLAGIIGALSAPVSHFFASIFLWCAQWCTWWIAWVAQFLAELPGSGISLLVASVVDVFLVCAIFSLVSFREKFTRKRLFFRDDEDVASLFHNDRTRRGENKRR